MEFLLNANAGPRFFPVFFIDSKNLKMLMARSRFFLKIAFHSSVDFQVAGKASSSDIFLQCFSISFFLQNPGPERPIEWRPNARDRSLLYVWKNLVCFSLALLTCVFSCVQSIRLQASSWRCDRRSLARHQVPLNILILPPSLKCRYSVHCTTLVLPEKIVKVSCVFN